MFFSFLTTVFVSIYGKRFMVSSYVQYLNGYFKCKLVFELYIIHEQNTRKQNTPLIITIRIICTVFIHRSSIFFVIPTDETSSQMRELRFSDGWFQCSDSESGHTLGLIDAQSELGRAIVPFLLLYA